MPKVSSVTWVMYLSAQFGFLLGFLVCALLRMGEDR